MCDNSRKVMSAMWPRYRRTTDWVDTGPQKSTQWQLRGIALFGQPHKVKCLPDLAQTIVYTSRIRRERPR